MQFEESIAEMVEHGWDKEVNILVHITVNNTLLMVDFFPPPRFYRNLLCASCDSTRHVLANIPSRFVIIYRYTPFRRTGSRTFFTRDHLGKCLTVGRHLHPKVWVYRWKDVDLMEMYISIAVLFPLHMVLVVEIFKIGNIDMFRPLDESLESMRDMDDGTYNEAFTPVCSL